MKPMLHDFDKRITQKIQSWPSRVKFSMSLATLIGQPIFTGGTGALIAGIGWGKSDARLFEAGLIVIGTLGVATLAKMFFRRGRPITEYVARMRFATFSLPSGHSAGAAVAYGLVVYIASQALDSPWQYVVGSLLTLLIIWIGLSRIYLGAHYPSDVIAGWLLGFVGLGVIIFMIQPVV
jgi:undecaprenyl-diphosphatase